MEMKKGVMQCSTPLVRFIHNGGMYFEDKTDIFLGAFIVII